MNVRSISRVVVLYLGVTILSGCTALQSIICKPQYVTSPVVAPPAISRPVLKTTEITGQTSDGDVVKYYRVAIQQLIDYSKSLEMIVEGYRKLSEEGK